MHDFSLLLAGLAFGVACTVRSNGLLYGVLFAEEAGRLIWSMKPSKTSGGAAGAAGEPVGLTANVTYTTLRRLTYTLLGGLSVAVGFAYPQYIAYQQFCTSTGARPWCSKTLPSVYSFLQSHYWGTGLFRYWTLSNIPLFLLAAPMLVLLFTSSIWAFQLNARLTTSPTHNVDHYQTTDKERQLAARTIRLLKSIAVPQTLLAVTALTSFHVQIVNRIASGYPVWYIFVAWGVVEQMKKSGGKAKTVMGNRKVGKKEAKMRETWKSWLAANWPMVTVRGMAMYALVQTVLFASFLPPA